MAQGCGSYSRTSWTFQEAHELLGRTKSHLPVLCQVYKACNTPCLEPQLIKVRHGQHKMVCDGPRFLLTGSPSALVSTLSLPHSESLALQLTLTPPLPFGFV